MHALAELDWHLHRYSSGIPDLESIFCTAFWHVHWELHDMQWNCRNFSACAVSLIRMIVWHLEAWMEAEEPVLLFKPDPI